jgi:beta-mannosidase
MVPEKDLPLQKPNINIKSQKVKSGFKLTVTTDTYTKALFLRANDVVGFFTDNYFDVTPEQPVSLIFETKIEVDDIVGKLKTYSLYDSSEH